MEGNTGETGMLVRPEGCVTKPLTGIKCCVYTVFPLTICLSCRSAGQCLVAQLGSTLCKLLDSSLPDFSVHGIFSGKNTGVGCHVLLQGIFLTQGSKLSLCVFFTAGRFFTKDNPNLKKIEDTRSIIYIKKHWPSWSIKRKKTTHLSPYNQKGGKKKGKEVSFCPLVAFGKLHGKGRKRKVPL